MRKLKTSICVFFLMLNFSSRCFAQLEIGQEELYDRFKSALDLQQYDEVRQTAQIYAASFPQSEQIYEVRYWLACLEEEYDKAIERLKEVARQELFDAPWSVKAYERISELELLRGRSRQAIEALRRAEELESRNLTSAPLHLTRLRLRLAELFLAMDRERNSEELLETFSEPEQLSRGDQERYWFCKGVALWKDGEEREFWHLRADFEDRFPNSGYRATWLAVAAGLEGRAKYTGRRVDRDILQEIIDFYPDSPEAYHAAQILQR